MVLCKICVTNNSLQNCTFSFGLIHSKKHHFKYYKTVYIYGFCLFVSEIVVKIDHVFTLETISKTRFELERYIFAGV